MTHYDVAAVLTTDPTAEQLEAVFEAFEGDPPTLSVRAGVPYASFTVASPSGAGGDGGPGHGAPSLADATREAMAGLRRAGLAVARFEIEPEAVEA